MQNEIDVGLVRKWFDQIDAANGIGEELYLAISQPPSINVDLIVKSMMVRKLCLHGVMTIITGPAGMCRESDRFKKIAGPCLKVAKKNLKEN